MVNWDEIKKELKKLTSERALEYLEYLLTVIKDKEILDKIRQEVEHIKELIKEKKDWKKIGEITPIRRDVEHELQEISRERPVRQELNLERVVDIMEKDLHVKEEEKGVEYNKGRSDYGQYLSEKIDMGYDKPGSTFEIGKLTEQPETRHIETMRQQRRAGYGEKNFNGKDDKKEEFKYQTDLTEYKRKKE
ncbi:MAG: hypothetical protein ISS82_06300 [Nanoarchaeota archaeon]|nr:hypothetical protein [Nanoarchaeota archaeon]